MQEQGAATELPALDAHGHLENPADWNPEVAQRLAGLEGITLSAPHWRVIELLREYHDRYEITPPMRGLVTLLRERMGDDSPDSRALYRLFPDGPIRQGCRIAGLPKPVSCI